MLFSNLQIKNAAQNSKKSRKGSKKNMGSTSHVTAEVTELLNILDVRFVWIFARGARWETFCHNLREWEIMMLPFRLQDNENTPGACNCTKSCLI